MLSRPSTSTAPAPTHDAQLVLTCLNVERRSEVRFAGFIEDISIEGLHPLSALLVAASAVVPTHLLGGLLFRPACLLCAAIFLRQAGLSLLRLRTAAAVVVFFVPSPDSRARACFSRPISESSEVRIVFIVPGIFLSRDSSALSLSIVSDGLNYFCHDEILCLGATRLWSPLQRFKSSSGVARRFWSKFQSQSTLGALRPRRERPFTRFRTPPPLK